MKQTVVFCAILVCIGYSQVQWSLDGVRISVYGSCQQNAQCIGDMNYGAIVAWEDDRSNSAAYDIYAQRIDSSGNLLWQSGGVPICFDPWYLQANIVMCSDEIGGAIIVWQDYRNSYDPDIYAQRIDSSGSCLWQVNGVPVCTAASSQRQHRVVSDGRKGAIIVWTDRRNYPEGTAVYAQRVDSGGVVRWQLDGVPVCTTAGAYFEDPEAIADGAGGVYVVWGGYLFPQYLQDIYFQHLDSTGNYLLPWTGVCIVGEEHLQIAPKMARGLENTLIVTWTDERSTITAPDIYAIRIDTLGFPLWDSTGVPICTSDSIQFGTGGSLLPDGCGGGIIHWMDYRNGSGDIYAQHVDLYGNQVWQQNGVPVIALPGIDHMIRTAVSDDSSGAIYWWNENRNGFTESFFQRIGADGSPRWAPDGVRACTVSTGERWGSAICSDGKGGAIVVWTDYRYGSYDTDIWGQRVNDGHAPGVTEDVDETSFLMHSCEVYPNPFSTELTISIDIEYYARARINVAIYDILGRLIRELNTSTGGYVAQCTWDGRDDSGRMQSAGVYFCHIGVDEKLVLRKVVLLQD